MTSLSRTLMMALLMLGLVGRSLAATPDEQLKSTVNTVMAALNDQSLTKETRWDTIRTATEARFDLELIGKLVLGQTSWNAFTADQRAAYLQSFKTILLQAYSQQLDSYAGERMEFGAAQVEGSKATVDSVMVSPTRRLPVVYKLRNVNSEWLVYDVVIDGVSLLKTYQTQYNDFLKQNPVDAFLAMLRDKAAQN